MKKISFIMIIVLVCGICLSACNASGNEPTEDANLEQPTTQESSKIEVKDIFLSKAELSLGIGESSTLIATKSPGNAPSELVWSSQNPAIASVDNNGTVTGVAEGDTVIKVEADNGIIAVCNVTIKQKTGAVTGNITYKYNDYVGNKPDTGAVVYLIATNTTSLPDTVAGFFYNDKDDNDGIYTTKVDGTGTYTFENIPIGEYYIIVGSYNVSNFSRGSGLDFGYEVYKMFSANGQELANLQAQTGKVTSSKITITADKTVTFSHDFGVSS